MKPVFDIDTFIHGKFAMHCRTEEEASIFCEYLSSQGRTWRGGHSYVDNTRYETHKGATAYAFNDGLYGSVKGCRDCGYTVLLFKDFDFSYKTIELKDVKRDEFFKLISC